MSKKVKNNRLKHRFLISLIIILLILSSITLIFSITRFNILPTKYLLPIIIGVIMVNIFMCILLTRKIKFIFKIPFIFLVFSIIAFFLYGTYFVDKTSDFITNIVDLGVKENYYELYVLKNNDYNSIDDINSKNLGIYIDSDAYEHILKDIKKTHTFKNEIMYEDLENSINSLISGDVDALLINDSFANILEDNYGELFNLIKVIDKFKIETKEEVVKDNIDITTQPFIIYISGIDTYGSINAVSRSDVNILAVINPNTGKILLVNTPRDYYVMLHSKKAYDKLTHAGIYGINEQITTLEDLYVADINYYFKVNFSSVIKIIDTLGGITVNSKYNFSYDGYTFRKGENYLNGSSALAFSRCRKELPYGDESRGENQEEVIKAIIKKLSSPNTIINYANILSKLERSFSTNLSSEEITSFAKMQLDNNYEWNIETENVTGTSSYDVTYSAGRTKLYVMKPDIDSITRVKVRINEILNEE